MRSMEIGGHSKKTADDDNDNSKMKLSRAVLLNPVSLPSNALGGCGRETVIMLEMFLSALL